MKIYVFANQKGGVGKTTSSVNLCHILAQPPHGKRCLLIDMDPQGHASMHVGVRDRTRRPPIYRLIVEEVPVRDVIQETKFGFDVIAGGIGNAVTELQLANIDDNMLVLAKTLKAIDDDYDLVFIDCPPSLGQLLLCALGAADLLIVPMPLQVFPVDGFDLLLEKVQRVRKFNPKIQLGAVFATMSPERFRLSRGVRAQLQADLESANLDNVLLSQSIRNNTDLATAPNDGEPIGIFSPKSKGALDYRALAKEMVERGIV